MKVRAPVGLHVIWPQMTPSRAWWETRSEEEQRKSRDAVIDSLKSAFEDARAYWKARDAEGKQGTPRHDRDVKWDAMGRALRGEIPVLIHAGASGVGSAAIQLARELGAFVIATSRSADKMGFLRDLGVHRAVLTTEEDFAEVVREESRGRGADVIVDFVGAAYAEKNQKALAAGGRWIVVGLLGGARATIDFGALLARRQTVRGIVVAREISEDLLLACSDIPNIELFEYALSVNLTRVQ